MREEALKGTKRREQQQRPARAPYRPRGGVLRAPGRRLPRRAGHVYSPVALSTAFGPGPREALGRRRAPQTSRTGCEAAAFERVSKERDEPDVFRGWRCAGAAGGLRLGVGAGVGLYGGPRPAAAAPHDGPWPRTGGAPRPASSGPAGGRSLAKGSPCDATRSRPLRALRFSPVL